MQPHRKKELGLWLPPHIFTIYSRCLQPAQLPTQIRDVVAQLLEPSPSSVCVSLPWSKFKVGWQCGVQKFSIYKSGMPYKRWLMFQLLHFLSMTYQCAWKKQ